MTKKYILLCQTIYHKSRSVETLDRAYLLSVSLQQILPANAGSTISPAVNGCGVGPWLSSELSGGFR